MAFAAEADVGDDAEDQGDSSREWNRFASAVSRGALHVLLRNPIYIGLIPHKGECFPGQHEGIVDCALWDAVQEKLKSSAAGGMASGRKTQPSPLIGKLMDQTGRLLTTSHANKRGRRYRYYLSHSDDQDADRYAGMTPKVWRLG